jgi:hypothetical protein
MEAMNLDRAAPMFGGVIGRCTNGDEVRCDVVVFRQFMQGDFERRTTTLSTDNVVRLEPRF